MSTNPTVRHSTAYRPWTRVAWRSRRVLGAVAVAGVIVLGAAIAVAAGNGSTAETRASEFKTAYQALTALAPEETASLVQAICDAEEDSRKAVGKSASDRVKDKIVAEYHALDSLKRQAVQLLDGVIDDASLADIHPKARKLKRNIRRQWTSVGKMTKGLRGANHPVVGYMLRQGQVAHKRRQESSQYCTVYEFATPAGRADCVHAPSCSVIEFKPNNPRSIAIGNEQVHKYARKLNSDATIREKLVAADSRFASCETFEERVDCYTLCPTIDPETNEYVSTALQWTTDCR